MNVFLINQLRKYAFTFHVLWPGSTRWTNVSVYKQAKFYIISVWKIQLHEIVHIGINFGVFYVKLCSYEYIER